MKVLVVLTHAGFYRHLDTVARYLCEQGHEVKVVTTRGRKDVDEDYQREMLSSVQVAGRGSYDFNLLRRRGLLARPITKLRWSLNHGIYFRAQHNSPQLGDRMAWRALPAARAMFASRPGRRVVSSNSFLAAYRRFQAHLPADRCLVRVVEAERPDVVVACPYIYRTGNDLEYVRAAQKLGIPTVAVVASWDNLSTKGTFHLLPDAVVVWNQRLAREAQVIHGIPRDRLRITGAAKFDAYFGLRASESREEFCARIGVDPARPYLLYIGSSEQVAGDETGFVTELRDALRGGPRTASLQVVVRPHPLNGKVWQDFHAEGITVFPRGGERPDIPGPRDDYFNTLHHSAAVAGVNTSAFLEAAIADRPCLSIVSERHREGQVERGHFQHLVKGGFIETVPDFAGAVDALGEVLEGRDARRERRRRFVASFVRPGGMDRPAGEVVAEAILETAAAGVREPEPVLPSKVAPLTAKPPDPDRRDRRPPTAEQERAALLRLHDEHPVPVRQPLVLVSQLGGGRGADLLTRLLDGHPACHVRPGRLAFGAWPSLDLAAPPSQWLEALEPAVESSGAANGQGDSGRDGEPPLLMVPSLERNVFDHCVSQWRPRTQREVLDCWMTAYFNAWLDYQRLYQRDQRWVVAAAGTLGQRADDRRAFFADYPDGRLVVVVGEPAPSESGDWSAAARDLLEARAAEGDRLAVVGERELTDDVEAAMREVARFLDLEFDERLSRPTLNGLPAPGLDGAGTQRSAETVEGPAAELYDQLVSAARSRP